jgi:cytochrome c-type biogenesis protein CcmH
VRRWWLPLAAAALLALGGLVLVEVLRPTTAPTRAEQARLIAAELRCPDCQALSVAESQTAAAAAIRSQIVQQLEAGRTPAQVRAYFVERYGDWILLAPSSPIAWWVPPAVVLLGIGIFARWLARGRSMPVPAVAPTGEAGERIRDEVERLDA